MGNELLLHLHLVKKYELLSNRVPNILQTKLIQHLLWTFPPSPNYESILPKINIEHNHPHNFSTVPPDRDPQTPVLVILEYRDNKRLAMN